MAVSIDSELAVLDRRMTALRIDYERFFSGGLKQPPLAARRELEQFLKRLGNEEVERASDRFRLQTIESRYNALRELWEKRLQAREQGRTSAGRPAGDPAATAQAAAPEAPAVDAATPADVKPTRRVDFSPLFERYCTARRSNGEDVSKLRYEKFEEQVLKQADEIRKKTGCRKLVFEIQTQDGKVRLIGRPAPAKG
jgi:TolA-binding protein